MKIPWGKTMGVKSGISLLSPKHAIAYKVKFPIMTYDAEGPVSVSSSHVFGLPTIYIRWQRNLRSLSVPEFRHPEIDKSLSL